MVVSDSGFYESLPAFRDFAELGTSAHYAPVPDDWVVFITDVVASTRAIEAGRYRDVNTLGAATISTALQALGHDTPYVFGGDGATVLVEPNEAEALERALCGLAVLAERRFKLCLRVGRIAIADLRAAGGSIEVARHELDSGRCVALFRGGGLSLADDLIKADPDTFGCRAAGLPPADLTGLSCRWDAIPSQRGVILSLIVVARPRNTMTTCMDFLRQLEVILGGPVASANPVDASRMRYRGYFENLAHERRFHGRTWGLKPLLRILEVVMAVSVIRSGLGALFGGMRSYLAAQRLHADHRKFDDMLRLVIDCTPAQADAIRAWLAEAFERGRCYYGIHESDSALMTCYVEGLGPGQHIHFVDGNHGGYALAAKGLKEQFSQFLSRSARPAVRGVAG